MIQDPLNSSSIQQLCHSSKDPRVERASMLRSFFLYYVVAALTELDVTDKLVTRSCLVSEFGLVNERLSVLFLYLERLGMMERNDQVWSVTSQGEHVFRSMLYDEPSLCESNYLRIFSKSCDSRLKHPVNIFSYFPEFSKK